jgi:transposase-like protein
MKLSLASVSRLSDAEARAVLASLRWPEGKPICPKCRTDEHYAIARRHTFRCKSCTSDYTLTSGTLFAASKIQPKDLLLGACLFVGGAKGTPSTQISRYMGIQYKTAWVLCHKLREATQRPDLLLSGAVEIDGCTIGGYRQYENTAIGKFQKRRYQKKYDNRRIVVVAREKGSDGKTKAFVGKREMESVGGIVNSVEPGSVIHADGSHAWDGLAKTFDYMARIDHSKSYKRDGACTNNAESFFALLRKMQYGTHHRIGGQNLEAYANELAWRQDNRALTEDQKIRLLLTLCFALPPSSKWAGVWQRKALKKASAQIIEFPRLQPRESLPPLKEAVG